MSMLTSSDTLREAPPRKRKSLYAYYAFFVLFVATLLNGLDSNEFTGASTVIARELHLGINDIGALASAFTICLTISIVPVGLWADRTKRSHVIAICLIAWSLATALSGLANSFLTLFVTRMFTGIGEAGYAPAGNSLASDFFQNEQRAKVMSWLSVAALVGPLLGLMLGGIVAGLAPGAWRYAFFTTGLLGLILALFAWRLREPLRRQTGWAAHDKVKARRGVWQPGAISIQVWTLLRIKTLVCLMVMGVVSAFTTTALLTYFPILLQQRDVFGLTSGQAALLAGLILGPTGFVGVVLGGYVADWLNHRHRGARILVCAVSALLTGSLFFAALLLMNTGNIVLFFIVLVPTVLINMMHLGPLTAAVLDVVPSAMRTSGMAVFTFIQRLLGTAFAPLLLGTLARSFDPGGLHFAHNLAGHDLILTLIMTCPPAFLGAGIVGVAALRWVGKDRGAAEQEE